MLGQAGKLALVEVDDVVVVAVEWASLAVVRERGIDRVLRQVVAETEIRNGRPEHVIHAIGPAGEPVGPAPSRAG